MLYPMTTRGFGGWGMSEMKLRVVYCFLFSFVCSY